MRVGDGVGDEVEDGLRRGTCFSGWLASSGIQIQNIPRPPPGTRTQLSLLSEASTRFWEFSYPFFSFLSFLFDRVTLCSSGCPGTPHVA